MSNDSENLQPASEPCTALVPAQPAVPAIPTPHQLLPIVPVALTPCEAERVNRLQHALLVLGPSGGSVLVCPGNDANKSQTCPHSAKCELLKMKKAPEGELCPLEANYVATRFTDWAHEINKSHDNLSESERATVSDLVWIDTQALRCAGIVSKGEAARLTQMNPKESHPETLEPISWERVIHANVVRLDQLTTQRRMILKDWMLTPEQKAKQARWEGRGKGQDLSTKQSAKADRLKSLGNIIDVEYVDIPQQ